MHKKKTDPIYTYALLGVFYLTSLITCNPLKETMELISSPTKGRILTTSIAECTCATTTIGLCAIHACISSPPPYLVCVSMLSCSTIGSLLGLGLAGERIRNQEIAHHRLTRKTS